MSSSSRFLSASSSFCRARLRSASRRLSRCFRLTADSAAYSSSVLAPFFSSSSATISPTSFRRICFRSCPASPISTSINAATSFSTLVYTPLRSAAPSINGAACRRSFESRLVLRSIWPSASAVRSDTSVDRAFDVSNADQTLLRRMSKEPRFLYAWRIPLIAVRCVAERGRSVVLKRLRGGSTSKVVAVREAINTMGD